MATTVPPFSDLSGVLIILAATAHVFDQDSTLPVWTHWGAVCGVCVTNGYMSSADSHHLTGHHAEAQPPGLHRRSQSSQCLTAPVQWPGPDRGHLRPSLTWRLLLRKENKRTNGTFGRWWRHWNTQTAVLGGSLHSVLCEYKRSVMHFPWITLWARRRASGLQYLLPCLIRFVSLILCFGVSDMLLSSSETPFSPTRVRIKTIETLEYVAFVVQTWDGRGLRGVIFYWKAIKKQE